MGRVLRLTLLAPEIIEVILNGRQPEWMRLEDLLEGIPMVWVEQRSGLCGPGFHRRLQT
jgi:hypothetical protein